MKIFNIIAGLVIAAAVIVVVIIFSERTEVIVIDQDTVFTEDYQIAKNQTLTVKNGAVLTFQGDLVIDGILECADGPLNTIINGDLVVNKYLVCHRQAANLTSGDPGLGISLVTKGSVVFDQNAVLVSNGSVQLVDSVAKLAVTEAQVNELYGAVAKDSDAPYQFGPFVPVAEGDDSGRSETLSNSNIFDSLSILVSWPVTPVKLKPNRGLKLIPRAQAAIFEKPCFDERGIIVPNCVSVGGAWILGGGGRPPRVIDIPTPLPGVTRVIINFNFGGNTQLFFQDVTIIGPDGRNGENDSFNSCVARGGDGRNGWRFIGTGRKMIIRNFTLSLGNGGYGGLAETLENCDPGIADGGAGGAPGNMRLSAQEGIDIFLFTIIPGRGGNGGFAAAYGKPGEAGCPGKKGGDAVARGGRGGDNRMELRVRGNVNGVVNILVEPAFGGEGGNSFSRPGSGGSGSDCRCAGGLGGYGSAIGGRGGHASILIYGAKSYGGKGGSINVVGGDGGLGGQCNPDDYGGNGGKGGDIGARPGLGGVGQTASGVEGTIFGKAGDGGNGGDGCNEGAGGQRGLPNGFSGQPGRNLCVTKRGGSSTSTIIVPPEEPPLPNGDGTIIQPDRDSDDSDAIIHDTETPTSWWLPTGGGASTGGGTPTSPLPTTDDEEDNKTTTGTSIPKSDQPTSGSGTNGRSTTDTTIKH